MEGHRRGGRAREGGAGRGVSGGKNGGGEEKKEERREEKVGEGAVGVLRSVHRTVYLVSVQCVRTRSRNG